MGLDALPLWKVGFCGVVGVVLGSSSSRSYLLGPWIRGMGPYTHLCGLGTSGSRRSLLRPWLLRPPQRQHHERKCHEHLCPEDSLQECPCSQGCDGSATKYICQRKA